MRNKTTEQLRFIIDDAGKAARIFQNSGLLVPNSRQTCESKYLDQMNEAASELYRRSIKTLKGKRK
jgi:hypothetical protein